MGSGPHPPRGLCPSLQEWPGFKRSPVKELSMCVTPSVPSLGASGSLAVAALLHRCQTPVCLASRVPMTSESPGVATSGFSVLTGDRWAGSLVLASLVLGCTGTIM